VFVEYDVDVLKGGADRRLQGARIYRDAVARSSEEGCKTTEAARRGEAE
jgi:hypothetical protein